MTKTFKADNTVQGAKIQADFCLDAGDDDGAKKWRDVAHVQKRIASVWLTYASHWSASQLRNLPANQRQVRRNLDSNRQFQVWIRFSPQRVVFTLTRNAMYPDGSLDDVVTLDRGVTRKTILRDPDRFFRSLAVSIVTRTGPLAIAD